MVSCKKYKIYNAFIYFFNSTFAYVLIFSVILFGFSSFVVYNMDNIILSLAVVPAKIYANADVQKVQILKENKRKPGISQWKTI